MSESSINAHLLATALENQRLRGTVINDDGVTWAIVELPDLIVGEGDDWELASGQLLIVTDAPGYRLRFAQRWPDMATASPLLELNRQYPFKGEYGYLHERARYNAWDVVVGEVAVAMASRGRFSYEHDASLSFGTPDEFFHELAEACRCEQYGVKARVASLTRDFSGLEFVATSRGDQVAALFYRNEMGQVWAKTERVRRPERRVSPVRPAPRASMLTALEIIWSIERDPKSYTPANLARVVSASLAEA